MIILKFPNEANKTFFICSVNTRNCTKTLTNVLYANTESIVQFDS